MQKASSLRGNWQRNVIFLVTALLVAAADQLSKTWIRSNLALGQSLPETGFPRLIHAQNTGSAFGLFQGQSSALIIVAIIGIALILILAFIVYRRSPLLDSRLGRLALSLILGGAVGNLTDRLRFGSVTDFIDVGFWPVFNVADSAVTVGVIIFAYSLLLLARAEKQGFAESDRAT
ncbi:signal peptidase II [Chloroflexota bacterium]